jgi:hypothetical protein
MSERTKVDCVSELPASGVQWDLEPLPLKNYDSYLDMIVDVTIESRAYRELVQVLLELLADAHKRERYRHDVHR